MSYKAMDWAIDQELPDLKGHLLIVLAKFANENYVAWPSISVLARKIGKNETSERHIKRVIFELNRDRYIAKKSGKGRQRSRYKLAVDGVRSLNEWLNNDRSYCEETLHSGAMRAPLHENQLHSGALIAPLHENQESVVVLSDPASGALIAPLNRKGQEKVIKKNKAKKISSEKGSDEKSNNSENRRLYFGSKAARVAVDNARKILAGSSDAELKTPLSTALNDSGLDLKNIVNCDDKENESLVEIVGNEADEESLVDNAVLEPWQF